MIWKLVIRMTYRTIWYFILQRPDSRQEDDEEPKKRTFKKALVNINNLRELLSENRRLTGQKPDPQLEVTFIFSFTWEL